MFPTNGPIRSLCRPRVRAAWARATLISITTLGGTGCTAWSPSALPRGGVAPHVAYDHPVQLTLSNQATLIPTQPQVVGDSIVGYTGEPARRVGVALSDVRQLDEQRVSAGRTAGLVLGVPALMLAGTFVTIAVLLHFSL